MTAERNGNPPDPAGLNAVLEQLRALQDEVRQLRGTGRAVGPASGEGADGEQLVTLDQAAAMVRRSKRTLEKYRDRLPDPRVWGGGGRPHLYAWGELRSVLVRVFGSRLPERFPGAN